MTTVTPSSSTPTTSSSSPPPKWPYNAARSTGTECTPLLAALLAASTLDEISIGSDTFQMAMAGYIRGQERVDAEDRTLEARIFWVYPMGLWGPFRETGDGSIKQQGLLVTMERGAKVAEAVEAIKANFHGDGTAHIHVAAS
ncbi:uncharacterized protein B0H18DRAFT_158278 [Fomitopsis serialis]|uniref:uncharacterized protein n=1 Tax=Fomitopsis serialis TaxID=139415 RepID=UPI0020076724|nr:uncharacterized protein B0H18DRAFT_158278 [Neoantrodia serialis]KAH9913731.1 hypothetical protein B0H18DRAFT_158278 [Neoantrodia serialis]